MGSPAEERFRRPDEEQRFVAISRPLLVAQRLVTQHEFARLLGRNPSHVRGANLPVCNVSWFDAVEFANRLSDEHGLERCYGDNAEFLGVARNGYRLPTSAEWEYAARAGVPDRRYGPLDAIAWFAKNAGGAPRPPGEKLPNAWGLFDVLGNLREWTNDRAGVLANVAPPTDLDAGVDPLGSTSGEYRVVRGGSFIDPGSELRLGARQIEIPAGGTYNGIRLVRSFV
jgi:formylglycine-generating enzyme required for sulfatase activity